MKKVIVAAAIVFVTFGLIACGAPKANVSAETSSFNIEYLDSIIEMSIYNDPCVVVKYLYTNNSDVPRSAFTSVALEAYQRNTLLGRTICANEDDYPVSNFYEVVNPGASIEVYEIFTLENMKSNIDYTFKPLGDTTIAAQATYIFQ